MKKGITIILVCVLVIAGFYFGMKYGADKADTISANDAVTSNTVEENATDAVENKTTEKSNAPSSSTTTTTENSSTKVADSVYYEKAVEFVKKEKSKQEDHINTKPDYKKFAEYEGFGVGEENGVTYAYMWIGDMSYYKENGKLVEGSGSSTSYKVKFKDGEVVSYENPTDGTGQEEDIKKMFPSNVANKILTYNFDFTRLEKAAKNYYN